MVATNTHPPPPHPPPANQRTRGNEPVAQTPWATGRSRGSNHTPGRTAADTPRPPTTTPRQNNTATPRHPGRTAGTPGRSEPPGRSIGSQDGWHSQDDQWVPQDGQQAPRTVVNPRTDRRGHTPRTRSQPALPNPANPAQKNRCEPRSSGATTVRQPPTPPLHPRFAPPTIRPNLHWLTSGPLFGPLLALFGTSLAPLVYPPCSPLGPLLVLL